MAHGARIRQHRVQVVEVRGARASQQQAWGAELGHDASSIAERGWPWPPRHTPPTGRDGPCMLALRLALVVLPCLALGLASPTHAGAEPAEAPALSDDATRDGALLVHVLVPLCHRDQVDCGSKRAGDPLDLEQNLYWGAIFGHRRFALRAASSFELVERSPLEAPRLERVVVRLRRGAGAQAAEAPELIVVLDAWRGDRIDEALGAFFDEAARGAKLGFVDAGAARELEVDLVGFAGHNPMLDGARAEAHQPRPGDRPTPSFVLACHSRATFEAPLLERGSRPLVLTQALMAPEGYLVEALALGLAARDSRRALRHRLGATYARWQSIEESVGRSIFAPIGEGR